MADLPDKQTQILTIHSTFIHMVVLSLLDPEKHSTLEGHLLTAENNGWKDLVAIIRNIMQGNKDCSLAHLDEEDRIIAEAILHGLQNPKTLPIIPEQAEATAAAPGLATLILQASKGDTSALQALGNMAQQMGSVGGGMAKVGATLKKMLDGERDIEKLTYNLDDKGRALIQSILSHLNRSQLH